LNDEKLLLYPVSAERLEIVDIPPGYTHDIINTGNCDMVMLVWANQVFDPDHPDTYPAIVDLSAAKQKGDD
jgi:UDP-2-acetamido-2,6-beta-L-arabino-hexul-4-ose reductase